ncbi:MAG: hypothetical protein H5U16_06000 [Roseovarius sp.]|nr:hypothetical protein [Roseovarius sp.]
MGVIRLSGQMTCAPHEIDIARAAPPGHIRLSRAEPGCLVFDMEETAPGVFTVTEG